MKLTSPLIKLLLTIPIICLLFAFCYVQVRAKVNIISYLCNPIKLNITMRWRGDSTKVLGNFLQLNKVVSKAGQKLLFATNGGMFKPDKTPLGLFIENGRIISPLNNKKGLKGNFYLDKKGVFYITKKRLAGIVVEGTVIPYSQINYATQSGPMLLINQQITNFCKPGSINLCRRNGVGILQDGQVLFAMSNGPINFYDFAVFFKDRGCTNALYLDGIISDMFLPGQLIEKEHAPFCVMIGVSK